MTHRHSLAFAALLPIVACTDGACSPKVTPPARPVGRPATPAPESRRADAAMIVIPAGSFVAGSTADEREQAYAAYQQTSGRDSARRGRWFERESERHRTTLPRFAIDRAPVTNAAYAEFVADTGRPPPAIDAASWKRQGFVQNYDSQVQRYNWLAGRPPAERENHPVVLVTYDDASAYCAWRGELVGAHRRLPTTDEYEKAARGADGLVYPWGAQWEATRLNSAVLGPGDTVPVGSFAAGASPYGMVDAAGNVFQWTATPWPAKKDAVAVKGSAWDDYGGVGRGASVHGRRKWVKHAIVGFRCAGPSPES